MKQTYKKLLSIAALVCMVAFDAAAVTPTYKIRSQGFDKTRKDVGMVDKINLAGMDDWWGVFSIIPEYTASFRSGDICSCLFGGSVSNIAATTTTNNCGDCDNSCGCCSIAIQGSAVASRSARAWLADYFYLPTDFNGTISFSPSIRNFVLDFDLFVGMDKWCEGMYFRIYGPFVHSRWNLDFGESITAAGANNYLPGYFTPAATPNASLLKSFASYASGNAPTAIVGTAPNTSITNTFRALQFAKIGACDRTENGFADLRAELGWNFWQEDNYHVGLNIQAAAPTGPKMHAEWLFNPQVGNGHHWELGGGMTAHYTFWRSEDENRHFGFYLDLNVTHLFKANEQRTFDLKGKPMSRYMLAQQFGANTQNLRGGASEPAAIAASKQFTGVYSPVANLSTLNVDVSIGAQADLVAMFNFTSGRFSWDLGYNFWGASCEKIGCPSEDCDDCDTSCGTPVSTLCDADQANTWALKGNARVYGFALSADNVAPTLVIDQAVALSASNSTATIFNGTTGNVTTATDTTSDNFLSSTESVDNAQRAWAGGAPSVALTTDPTVGTDQIYTSIQPVFLSCADLDLKGVRGISNKVFTHLSWTFDRENWVPFIGIGASGEFGQSECGDGDCSTSTSTTTTSNCGDCSDSCNDCVHCSLSQWAVWLKAGISFN